MINHHPSSELLLSFAAGNLSEGFSLLVATHLAMCPECRRRLRHAESIGGALLQSMDPVAVSENALPDLMARIDAEESGEAAVSSVMAPEDVSLDVPKPLSPWINGGFDDLRWRTLAPGMKQIVLPLDSSGPAKTRLLKLAPGVVTPAHSHKGQEITLVLKGSFSDELGRFGPGDVQEADGEVKHQPMADTGEECICLVVTDAPLKFDNLVGKILQPIFGY